MELSPQLDREHEEIVPQGPNISSGSEIKFQRNIKKDSVQQELSRLERETSNVAPEDMDAHLARINQLREQLEGKV